ncbi:MerR family transcriptional regulator [Arenibaculum sp.]|jgi:DNA-binding transcriptional MerR regulator|uniref:MerR family transcriptional regulator n=1 Tax=Arenibaculum sp. TaxID=2865862 RepID=UPI002E146B9D|nr:MerR family transcriptional regulator [Arenibaculum sp.]
MAATHPDPRPRPVVKSAAAFRTISEVSAELDVPQHVLRFWETKFPQIRPLKRGGGRRYYRPEDVDLLRRIQSLLYREGYTIKGVQRLLRETRTTETEGVEQDQVEPDLLEPGEAEAGVAAAPRPPLDEARRAELREVLDELIALRALLGRGET